MAKNNPPKPSRNTPLKPGDTQKGRKVGAPGTPNNPKAVVKGGQRKAEKIDPKFDPKKDK